MGHGRDIGDRASIMHRLGAEDNGRRAARGPAARRPVWHSRTRWLASVARQPLAAVAAQATRRARGQEPSRLAGVVLKYYLLDLRMAVSRIKKLL